MQRKTKHQDTHSVWPADGLDRVPDCPVCGTGARELLHENLADRVFYCAPGEWNMYRCKSCASAWLDPCPSPETIGLAYKQYFTHSKAPGSLSPGYLGKLRQGLANGYRGYRFGTKEYPAYSFGVLVASLMPNRRASLDAGMRHLAKAEAGQRLLDLGCGNGEFLLRARSAGWDVVGVDFDSKAVEAARGQGLNVLLGGVESLDPSVEKFDVITLANVIEHVHQAGDVLRACCKLLKPGGRLWIETPNIDSFGHRRFARHWRGLEPPRHLVIFNWSSLEALLLEAGFHLEQRFPRTDDFQNLAAKSRAIKAGTDPYQSKITLLDRIIGFGARLMTNIYSRNYECVTIMAV